MFQNIRILFLPWLVCTVLATAVETGIDGWILHKVEDEAFWVYFLLFIFRHISHQKLHLSSQLSSSFSCCRYIVYCPHAIISKPVPGSVQVYTVSCTAQLYRQMGSIAVQDGDSSKMVTKVCTSNGNVSLTNGTPGSLD